MVKKNEAAIIQNAPFTGGYIGRFTDYAADKARRLKHQSQGSVFGAIMGPSSLKCPGWRGRAHGWFISERHPNSPYIHSGGYRKRAEYITDSNSTRFESLSSTKPDRIIVIIIYVSPEYSRDSSSTSTSSSSSILRTKSAAFDEDLIFGPNTTGG